MRMPVLLAIAVALPLMAAGCGEKPEAKIYKQGEYQGRTDTKPWSDAQFKGDQAAWEKAIKARNENQNEYVRIGN